MPMFYFDVLEVDGTVTRATEALELKDAEAALRSAKEAVCEIILHVAPMVGHLHIAITVRDDGGAELGKSGAGFDHIDRRR